MDRFALFPCNIETNEATSTIILLEMFRVYVMKMKISDFLKTHLLMNLH